MIFMLFSIMYARDCTRFKEAYGTRRYANICLHEHDISLFQTSRRNNSHDLHADACLGFIAFGAIFSFRNFSKNTATFGCKNIRVIWMLSAFLRPRGWTMLNFEQDRGYFAYLFHLSKFFNEETIINWQVRKFIEYLN